MSSYDLRPYKLIIRFYCLGGNILIASTFPLTAGMQAFEHTPLERSPNIQLVEALPGKDLEVIKCKMMSVDENNPHPYQYSPTLGEMLLSQPLSF